MTVQNLLKKSPFIPLFERQGKPLCGVHLCRARRVILAGLNPPEGAPGKRGIWNYCLNHRLFSLNLAMPIWYTELAG